MYCGVSNDCKLLEQGYTTVLISIISLLHRKKYWKLKRSRDVNRRNGWNWRNCDKRRKEKGLSSPCMSQKEPALFCLVGLTLAILFPLQRKGRRWCFRASKANSRTRTCQASAKNEDRTYERGWKAKTRSGKFILPQLNHLHGTKQSCWRVRDALGQDKQTVHII